MSVLTTGELSIINTAFGDARLERITAPDQGETGRYAGEQYPLVRDALLRRHPWNFASRRAILPEILPPADYWGAAHAYALPVEYLAVRAVEDEPWDAWRVEEVASRTCVTTDAAAPLRTRLTVQVTDPNRFTADFRQVLACALAIRFARRFGAPQTAVESLKQDLGTMLDDARTVNSQEGVPDAWPDVYETVDWIEARR